MSIYNLSYHQTSSSENRQVDELMIANMLNALNNPHILKMLDDEELKKMSLEKMIDFCIRNSKYIIRQDKVEVI